MVPYATLGPLKAVLPFRHGDDEIPKDGNGPGGINLSGLDQRMRGRWRTISDCWDTYKAAANRLSLVDDLDYLHKLTSQLQWRPDDGSRPIRVVQTEAGQPTAALLAEATTYVDETLYWISCKDLPEAHYLLAIINSQILYEMVQPLMPKGQFGARHLHKHLWKLPIPEFDPANPLHVAISEAGETAAAGAAKQLAQLREQRDNVTVTIARREIRKWLRESDEGKAVEEVVAKLLGTG